MREFFTIAIFKIKADIRMNKTTLNSQKEKHSLLSLRRATFVGLAAHRLRNISIHALLAESDRYPIAVSRPHGGDFYPRSAPRSQLARLAFLSTLSLRRATVLTMFCNTAYSSFLSTLSLRRATSSCRLNHSVSAISIHALLAESDNAIFIASIDSSFISIHALLAESD